LWNIPMLQEVRSDFSYSADVYTCDRAGATIRCVHGRAIDSGTQPLREPCSAHIVSTAQERAWRGVGT
jgi:hypothetical protein